MAVVLAPRRSYAPAVQVPLPHRRSTKELAAALARALRPGDLVIFTGELGTGKTFLVRAALRALGWPAHERVTSPTFSLIHDYALRPSVAHADLYRLADASELEHLGLRDRRASGAACLVEWGGPYAEALGGDALHVELELGPRRAGLRATGERSRELLASVAAALATSPRAP